MGLLLYFKNFYKLYLTDTSEFEALDRDGCNEEMLATPQEASQFMYITGICFAMLVLLVSILVHYYDSIAKVVTKVINK